MSVVVCLGLFLGLVFSLVSCSQNYEEGPGSSPKGFTFYSPIQSQGTYSRSVASSFGLSSHQHGPVSYRTASRNVHPGVSRSSLPASGATEHSVNQNNPSFQPRKSYGGKSWSSMAKPSVVSSGGIIIVQEGGGSQGSLKVKKPNQRPVNSNGSRPSKVNQIRWRSGNVQSGSTSSNSFQSGALDYSARGNQNTPGSKPVLSSRTSFSPANPSTVDAGERNQVEVGVSPSASHRRGSSSFGSSWSSSGDQRGTGFRDQKPASVQKLNQAPQVRFGIPESSTCIIDIPESYGRGSIRRCSRYREDSVWLDSSSDTSLQLSQSQFNQNFSPSRSSGTAGSTNAVQTNDGGVSRTPSTLNSPVLLQAWSGNHSFPGDTNQDIVPFQHSSVQSSHAALMFHPGIEAASSGGYMVSRNAPNPADIIQNHYSTRLHEHEALPGSSAPSAWNGRNPSSCTTRSSGSSPQQRGGVSRSASRMKPVSELYRSSQRGVWNVLPENEGASSFNGYSRRSLSSKVSDSRQAPAAGSFRDGYSPEAASYKQTSTRDQISTIHHQLSIPSK